MMYRTLLLSAIIVTACTSESTQRPEGDGEIAATQQGVTTPATVSVPDQPADALKSKIVDSELEAETEAPMVGKLDGLGTFRATGTLRLIESRTAGRKAEISFSGWTDGGAQVGFSTLLTPTQAAALAVGAQVPFDGLTGIRYGTFGQQVTQPVLSLQVVRNSDATATYYLSLGGVTAKEADAPASLGVASNMELRGNVGIECLVPGSEDQPDRLREEPRRKSNICKSISREFGLESVPGAN